MIKLNFSFFNAAFLIIHSTLQIVDFDFFYKFKLLAKKNKEQNKKN